MYQNLQITGIGVPQLRHFYRRTNFIARDGVQVVTCISCPLPIFTKLKFEFELGLSLAKVFYNLN